MKFSNLRISHRLSLCFGIILVLMAAVTALAGWSSHRAQQQLAQTLRHTNDKVEIAARLRQSLFRQGQAARNVGTLSDLNLMQKEMIRIVTERSAYRVNQAALLKAGVSAPEQVIIAEMQSLDQRSEPLVSQAQESAAGFNAGQAAKVLNTQVAPLQSQWLEAIDRLVQLQQQQIQNDLDAFNVSSNRTTMATVVICAGAMLLAVLVAWRLNRSITRPLNQAVALASRVAEGDLTAQIEVVGTDETGQLLSALRSMNLSLQKTVGEVRAGTQNMFSVSQQNAAGNSDLAARTDAQAESLRQTADAMAQLSGIVSRNADQIGDANRLAQSAAGVASRGGELVASVVGTMSAIKDSSRKVVDIIAVIDGIAFQTNILALNAAVEAARAGELGRGFAVVATEVRQLAMRSAAAAKEIKVLIGDSVTRIDAGSRQVNDAGQTMHEIVDSVGQVVAIMEQIAAASDGQNHGIAELNQSLAQIDAVTRNNATLVAEAAQATTDMQEQAHKLWQAVGTFRLGHEADELSTLVDLDASALENGERHAELARLAA